MSHLIMYLKILNWNFFFIQGGLIIILFIDKVICFESDCYLLW